jgi:hypothetical protein
MKDGEFFDQQIAEVARLMAVMRNRKWLPKPEFMQCRQHSESPRATVSS